MEFWTPGYSPNNSILDPNYDLRRVYVFFVSGRPYIAATIPRLDTSQRVLQYEGVARFCRSQHGLSTQKKCLSCTCGFLGVGGGRQGQCREGRAHVRRPFFRPDFWTPIMSAPPGFHFCLSILDPNYEAQFFICSLLTFPFVLVFYSAS